MSLLLKLAKYKVIIAIVFTLALGLAMAPTAFGTGSGTKLENATCAVSSECSGTLVCVDNICSKPSNGGGDDTDTFGISDVEGTGGLKLGSKDLVTTVIDLLNVGLGLLGILSVIIILVGGFKWMTAGGNDEKVTEARKWIFSGIIGLAIILSAWAIARFVISQLSTATGSGTVPTNPM